MALMPHGAAELSGMVRQIRRGGRSDSYDELLRLTREGRQWPWGPLCELMTMLTRPHSLAESWAPGRSLTLRLWKAMRADRSKLERLYNEFFEIEAYDVCIEIAQHPAVDRSFIEFMLESSPPPRLVQAIVRHSLADRQLWESLLDASPSLDTIDAIAGAARNREAHDVYRRCVRMAASILMADTRSTDHRSNSDSEQDDVLASRKDLSSKEKEIFWSFMDLTTRFRARVAELAAEKGVRREDVLDSLSEEEYEAFARGVGADERDQR